MRDPLISLILLAFASWAIRAQDETKTRHVEAVKQEWKKLEGTWLLTKMEANGKSLLEKDEPAPKIVIKDGKIKSDRKADMDDEELDSKRIQLDPTRKPKTITVPNYHGGDPAQGVSLIGIYEIAGDELRVCAEAVETANLKARENDRPTAFDSKQGMLLVLKRQKDARLAVPPGAGSSDLPPFVKNYAKTMTFYYTSPDPRLGPKLLSELLKKENIEHPWFAPRDHVLLLIGAQLGDIAAHKPKMVRAYESVFNDAPLAGRRVVIRALMNCGDGDTIKQVDAWLADRRHNDIRPELEAVKQHLADAKRKSVRDRPAREAKDLDFLWANFFITGEFAPVSRILDVLDLPDDQENLVLKRVARLSLGSNLQQHPKLVELIQNHAKDRPMKSRTVIEELIPKAGDAKGVLGRWVSQDAAKEPLIFEKDGSFTCGFIKENDKWVMAKGTFTIADGGKIKTESKYEGSTVYRTFTLRGGVITGNRGPKRNVEWQKEKP